MAGKKSSPPILRPRGRAWTGHAKLDAVLERVAAPGSREAFDDALVELGRLARRHVPRLATLYRSGAFVKMPLVYCLIGQTSPAAFHVFADAVTDDDRYVRWAGVQGLARCSAEIASPLVIAALQDRTMLVKGSAIEAQIAWGDPAAIPHLEKIIASALLRKRAPGLVQSARTALARCRGNGALR